MEDSAVAKSTRRQSRKIQRDSRKSVRNASLREIGMQITQEYGLREVKPIAAMTESQGHYLASIQSHQLTFGVGPAGTGKSYLCTALAADALRDGKVEKLILTRPAVEAGESLGFLPGLLSEKFEPFMAPLRQTLEERLGRGQLEYMLKSKQIEPIPLAYLRGSTFKNCWVILDEAQNCSPSQMKMFLTRIGMNSKIIINGDVSQSDIVGLSGLEDAINRLEGLRGIGMVHFDEEDIVRSGLAKLIVKAYR